MKGPGGDRHNSQVAILYRRAAMLRLGVQQRIVSPGSGLFIVYTADPADGADVQLLTRPGVVPPRFTVGGEEWLNFLRARPVPRMDAAVGEWTACG